MTTRFAKPILSAVLLLALLASPARAGSFGSGYYQCTINISGATQNCVDGVIAVTTSSGSQRVSTVDLSSGPYVRLDAFVDVCNPTGYWAHFGDSPTSDGGGGDFGNTEHDAEAYNNGLDFYSIGTFNTGRSGLDLVYVSQSVIPASGCYRVQWTIFEDRAIYDDDANPDDTPRAETRSIHSFESAPYAETDNEDTTSADANKWYVGLNRTVGSSTRTGTGVTKACFVLSTTTTPASSTLTSACP